MKSFQEELDDSKGNKSLIIGNGFGVSYDIASEGDSFNWNTLLDLCDIGEGSPVHELLAQCNFDFEIVHQKLNNAVDVISKYDPESELIPVLQEQVQYLREQLFFAVAKSHPSSFNRDCSEAERKFIKRIVGNCRNFLTGFDTVFSLNYDLLLYWVRCFENRYLGRDSFDMIGDELVFSPDEDASFLFPHGALFLYRDGVGATKSRSSRANPILTRVQSSIRQGHFPMCISEGTGKQKLEAIKSNTYLLFAYDQIKQCEDTIFTFGCSFQEQKDDHIINAMLESPAAKIIVGEFRPDDKAVYRLKHEFARLQSDLKTEKEILVADTEGTKLW